LEKNGKLSYYGIIPPLFSRIFSDLRLPHTMSGTLCVGKPASTSFMELGVINQVLMKTGNSLVPELLPLSLADRYHVQTVTRENKEEEEQFSHRCTTNEQLLPPSKRSVVIQIMHRRESSLLCYCALGC